MNTLQNRTNERTNVLQNLVNVAVLIPAILLCQASIGHAQAPKGDKKPTAEKKSDKDSGKKKPAKATKKPKGLTEKERFDIEDLLDKPVNPPKGIDVERGPDGIVIEIHGPDGKVTKIRKIRKPRKDGATHEIERPDGTLIMVTEDYYVMHGDNWIRVYDRNSGKYLFQDPISKSNSAIDQVEPPLNQLVWHWTYKHRKGGMSLDELKHRLRSRGYKWDPKGNRPRILTKDDKKQAQLERGKGRKARDTWLGNKRDAAESQSSSSLIAPSGDAFSGASTALAEVVLPKGTPVIVAPVPAGSHVKFNEPATVFIATGTATASVVEDPEEDAAAPPTDTRIVERRVEPGDQIPADQIVAIHLDSGLGIIPSHVSDPAEITVHTGRDEIVHETSNASQTNSTADSDEQSPQVSLNNGTFVASILSDQPYAESEVGTGEGPKSSSQTHIEILVDGKKQGEVTTFSGVDPKLAKEKPLHFRTRDEDGKIRREGKFDGTVVDVTLKVRFDKPIYRLGGQGVLLIWNQQTFFEAQQKNRIGGPTKPSDWILTIDPSGSVAGLPRKAGFDTHRLPFTVVGKGQLRATVRAVLRKPAASSDARHTALPRAN